MYGLIVKLTVAPGTRDKMVAILKESAADMPGCLSYVVAEDSADRVQPSQFFGIAFWIGFSTSTLVGEFWLRRRSDTR